ncbi:MAG: UDP-N-acetylmuramoyl-tripeptide--D-alanyl-D-alanine ligase [Candidatus Taylorbacteria bacterium]|nr:UDP-N-acetylmuramoyl-tripeptide--D-alanyl-D-alanine ligase [Candidatus Taylorbacteria bacterium]
MKTLLKKIVARILKWQASAVLKKYNPKIIAVTGNVGKTSTKDAIYSVLSPIFFVRKSEKSFNSDIGVPLTILGAPNAWTNPLLWIKNIFNAFELMLFSCDYPKWLILEVGADRPGDIEGIAKWVKSDVVIVTRFSNVPVHVEFFKSKEHLVEEKGFLVKALKNDGLLILNYDDPDAMNFKKASKNKVITYGFNQGADIQGSHPTIVYASEKPTGICFKINVGGNSVPISLDGVVGMQHFYPVLAAVAVGNSQNLNMVEMSQAFSCHKVPQGRMNLIEGKNDSIIIDDTYNSSPIAVHEALETIKSITTTGKKIVCVGDMMELGKFSIDEHKKVGANVSKIANVLITVGQRSRYTYNEAIRTGMSENNCQPFENSRDAGEYLATLISKGDIVLVKGSQSMRMERVVEAIMAHPECKKELLVRQDEEWVRR